MTSLKNRYPGAAVVTGASAGIGKAFAARLAREGFEVVIAARRREALEALADELRAAHDAKVHVVDVDLGTYEGPAALKAATDQLGLDVRFVVNNAGFGSWGLFHTLDPASEAGMIDLNCRGTMLVARAYAPDMVAKGNGAIVITASTAAFQPTPFFAAYGATKAFDLMFAEALWAELCPHGVDVIALCPGYTRTEFQQVAGINKEFAGAWREPEQVVETCLRKLGKGPSAIDGILNAIMARGAKLVPERLAIMAAYGVLRRLQ